MPATSCGRGSIQPDMLRFGLFSVVDHYPKELTRTTATVQRGQVTLAYPLVLKHRLRKGGCPRHGKETPSSPSTLAGVLFLSLVLAGCASPPLAGPGGDADYRHPRTGDIQHCDDHTTAGLLLFGVIGAVVSGNNYADCKNDLEGKGVYPRSSSNTIATGRCDSRSARHAPATFAGGSGE